MITVRNGFSYIVKFIAMIIQIAQTCMVVNKNTTLQKKKNKLVILYLSHIETKELHV